ncbi:MAG: hypothetical protein AAGF53_12855 [Pseudomonadota bacterium]
MHGVILWGDQRCDRALIWCEDHGSLAFYNAPSVIEGDRVQFDAGDLVQFDVQDGDDMRLATNLSVVATEEFPYLASQLKDAMHDTGRNPSAQEVAADKKVVALKRPKQPRMYNALQNKTAFNS